VDADRKLSELARGALEGKVSDVAWQAEPQQALFQLEQDDYKVLLAGAEDSALGGPELCRAARAKRPDLEVIVTARASVEQAVGAMRAGALDFLAKPVTPDALIATVDRALRHVEVMHDLQLLDDRSPPCHLPGIVGQSPEIKKLADIVSRVASSDASVLVMGESGTGKELVVRALHELSGRSGPFLAVNCAALPETLLEAELFGHARGAFTDARKARAGLFVEGNGGTLLLDEIGEMATSMQAKLLRALQERRARPLGSSHEVPFDTRIVAATNQDLDKAVEEGSFREDLYYRINVVRVDVPPLRQRGSDALLLARHFLHRAAQRMGKPVERLGELVAAQLIGYDWPGNVRELENCMERAVAMARFDEVTLDDLPRRIREFDRPRVFVDGQLPEDLPPMHVVEERYAQKVLRAVGGNKTQAAKILGVNRRTLYRKFGTS
jgi:two-component system response regulator HydG